MRPINSEVDIVVCAHSLWAGIAMVCLLGAIAPASLTAFAQNALDFSHVQMAGYMSVSDCAMRQAMSVQLERPPTTTNRFYSRNELSLTFNFRPRENSMLPDRQKLSATVSPLGIFHEARSNSGPWSSISTNIRTVLI